MKSIKSALFFLLALAVLFQNQSIMYASAAETRFIDVAEGAWYADAVAFCAENGLTVRYAPARSNRGIR